MMRRKKPTEASYQVQVSKSQPSGRYPKHAEEITAETADHEETLSISDKEEWNPPAEFADMLTTVSELLDKSANVKRLKQFLKFFCHPRTQLH